MGACYSVSLRIKILDEQGLVRALQAKLAKANEDHTNYHVNEFVSEFGKLDNPDNLIRIFLAGWSFNQFDKVTQRGGWVKYYNAFNASYGWETVMMEMFATIAPYVVNKSNIYIYPDSDYDYGVVENGKAIWKH